jgi:hypothetical protein
MVLMAFQAALFQQRLHLAQKSTLVGGSICMQEVKPSTAAMAENTL